MPLYIKPIRLAPSCRLHHVDHHLAHAAAAHFTRGHSDRYSIATMDGIGDDVSVALWIGENNDITLLRK
jgi:predicted NodU family carbamoyl transferase